MHPELNQPGPTPEPKRLAGKYESVEQLEKGYQELLTQSNQNYQRLQMMENELELIRQNRMNPAERAASRPDPREALSEVGVPSDAIETLVQEQIQRAFEPFIAAQNARSYAVQAFPDFDKFEQQVAEFIRTNPDRQARYTKLWAADPQGALEWAIQSYQRSKPQESPGERRDAGLPGSSTPGNRNVVQETVSEDLKKKFEFAQNTGDWTHYIKARLDGSTSDEHYKGLGY